MPTPEAALTRLTSVLGDRATTATAEREHHSKGESYHPRALPDVVCYPRTTDEVSAILKVSAEFQVPVIPFGAGSSLEAQVNAVHGGMTIDLREMNRVLRVSADDLDATVEAGVLRKQLNKVLDDTGLTFFINPGAGRSHRRHGVDPRVWHHGCALRTMRENVLGLTVVLVDGSVVRTGTRARKSSAGYDLTRLFVGAEGTLGVVTEVTLRLHPLPEAVSAAVCGFETLQGAVETVIKTIQVGMSVARIEPLDAAMMKATNAYSKTSYEVTPTLF